MKRTVTVLFFLLLGFVGAAKAQQTPKGVKLYTDLDSLSYFVGVDFGKSVQTFTDGVEGSVDMSLFVAGMYDFLNDRVEASEEERLAFLRNYMGVVNPEKLKAAHDRYFEQIERQEGVQKTESGLCYKIIREGNLERRAVNDADQVEVMYEGKLRNGKIFDSSYERGEAIVFTISMVISGWAEGVKLIGEGGEIILYIPYYLGYGANGVPRGGISGYQPLEFRVELIEVISAPTEE